MPEQLIYELNGKKYLLVELFISQKTSEGVNGLVDKYNCIYQGIKEINRGGFLSSPFVVAKYLVPEENIIEFNKENSLKP